jgi:hypothetical protein
MSVPEIDSPVLSKTHWSTSFDFTYADRTPLDLLANTPNVSLIINFTTTPGWMWATDSYTYPEDPHQPLRLQLTALNIHDPGWLPAYHYLFNNFIYDLTLSRARTAS